MAQASIPCGFLLPTREVVMSQPTPEISRLCGLAEQAEGHGFDSLWVGDSIIARPRLEPLTTLAAVAARTRRVKLGTAVLLPALRHPVVLANELANLDLIAEGRLVLGLGIAAKNPAVEAEFLACGVRFGRRIGVFEENVNLMRLLWTEPEVSFAGRYFTVDHVRPGLRPRQKSGIPLWLAGATDNALRRVARLGDGWLPIVPSPEDFSRDLARLRVFLAAEGKSVEGFPRCLYTTLNINNDVDRADKEMREFVHGYYGVSYETMAARQGYFAGRVDECTAWLNRFTAAGVQSLVIRFATPDQSGQIERFAREVMPKLRSS